MNTYFRLSTALAIVLGLLAAGPAARARADDDEDLPIHALSVAAIPADVFVSDGQGGLITPDPRTTALDAPLFSMSGAALNQTWGQFSSASAEATARRGRHQTKIRIKLSGLVPNGVYSIFYQTFGPDSDNPLCPGVVRLLALTSADPGQQPDASSFVASRKGKATFKAVADSALLDAQRINIFVIWHADGQTYGPLPNRAASVSQGPNCRSSFGSDAFRQLLIVQQSN